MSPLASLKVFGVIGNGFPWKVNIAGGELIGTEIVNLGEDGGDGRGVGKGVGNLITTGHATLGELESVFPLVVGFVSSLRSVTGEGALGDGITTGARTGLVLGVCMATCPGHAAWGGLGGAWGAKDVVGVSTRVGLWGLTGIPCGVGVFLMMDTLLLNLPEIKLVGSGTRGISVAVGISPKSVAKTNGDFTDRLREYTPSDNSSIRFATWSIQGS